MEIHGAAPSYPALVGSGLIASTGEEVAKRLRCPRCAIISDTNIAPLLADRVKQSLTSSGFQPTLITIPAGEKSKTLEQAGAICDQMIAAGLDRQSFVIAVGGGVIGDISGFVAAIFHRGISHVQIPTTLLAMVDSSIGGKTGVNTGAGKNLIGAVHHPALVIDDVDVLKTLPQREFNQGFAEIIKHAIIADAEMFDTLKDVDLENLAPLIRRNIEIKSRIVAKDERDRTGERAVLNFGHTVGHAIERAGDYRKFLHGEASWNCRGLRCLDKTRWTAARSAQWDCGSFAAVRFSDASAAKFSTRKDFRSAAIRQEIRERRSPLCCDASDRLGAFVERRGNGRHA